MQYSLQRQLIWFSVVSVLLLVIPVSVQAGSRVALVVGDGQTRTALNDASVEGTALVKDALAAAGYKTIEASIINKDGIQWALDLLVRQLKKGGTESVGFVYFAGYSIVAFGENYLIPANVRIDSVEDVVAQGYPLSRILKTLSSATNGANAVALDACSGNPFYGDGAVNSFADMSPPAGTLVSFCAPPGTTAAPAADAAAYSRGLADAMAMSGVTLAELFAVTRWSVMKNAPDGDLPWTKSALGKDKPFALPGTAARDPMLAGILAEAEVAPSPPSANNTANAGSETLDDILWRGIMNSENPGVFREYMAQFPDGKHVEEARLRAGKFEHRQSSASPLAGKSRDDRQTASKLTAILTGTDAPGFAGYYLPICGADITYRMNLKGQEGQWVAQLFHSDGKIVFDFKQREESNADGTVMLHGFLTYDSFAARKMFLRVNPVKKGKITLSIPISGIGNCAFGYAS
ncbi:hypothetical protein EOI86_07755 [Hwanghaeella grinnelliae]|uniref:Caspase family protein n=1 Tax=Hwanghaeella grinnelliae TaxID=2500179 RepID=A0A437QX94_9PROT|nr:hypothetical protein [Hwanghaeella grinnelliae]RVU39134.1 hypothetical protein EOI86_07755 [Hwanghaeella grinnelliae]